MGKIVKERTFDLEMRLIDFAVLVMDIVESLPHTQSGRHVGGQLLKSGTSPAPNYSEATSAESRKDFIHKMKISLKELRETRTWFLILRKRQMGDLILLKKGILECQELIKIVASSIQTAKKGL